MVEGDQPPIQEDRREDDFEFDPSIEPKSAKAWLNLIKESEDAFEQYNYHCDNIDRNYANLMRLGDRARPKEFQMYWANASVLQPSIYAQPPVPVVTPKFLDRRPVYTAASEVLERCCQVAFDLANIDTLMKLVRNDLAMIDRGVAWLRYESKKDYEPDSEYATERVCIDFKDRRDFLHSLSRNWREVTWVAAASYMTRKEARERFKPYSGDEYQDADYVIDRDVNEVGGTDERERAKIWEIWDKSSERVVWVAEGCENILDESDPHLDLRNFFPCPCPAYGTVQRGSLVPVPDVLQYKDQLDEINLLTSRIHALSEAVVVRGFYPAGGGEVAEAIQAAIATNTPGEVLVPIKNWATFGATQDPILWLPIDTIAQTITGLVALRQQIVQDIYQIMGLSDIMRGSTSPEETLGAQQLKSQYGSVRIRDKQQELVRLSRDIVEIASEIITEKFSKVTIIKMSQTQLPTDAMVNDRMRVIEGQIAMMQKQMNQAMGSPQARQMMQQDPNQAGQISDQSQQQLQDAQDELRQLAEAPTIEQVFTFLSDNRAKAFVLDIETDSTILVDEMGEKQARNEFIGVLSQLLPQLGQLISAAPETADFCAETLKFSTAPYRAGRSMQSAIDDLAERMKLKSGQPQGPDPITAQNQAAIQIEQIKSQTSLQNKQADLQFKAQELAQADRHKQMDIASQQSIAQAKLQSATVDQQADVRVQAQKVVESREAHQLNILKAQQDMQLQREKAANDQRENEADRAASRQQSMIKAMQPPAPRAPSGAPLGAPNPYKGL
jgi:hypothetical protein